MGVVRRTVVSLGLAALAAAGIRIGGGKEIASQRGGWSRMILPTETVSTGTVFATEAPPATRNVSTPEAAAPPEAAVGGRVAR